MSTSDVLPASLPHLEVSGTNWAEFVMRFRTAIRGKGIWGHFDGSVPRPVLELPKLKGPTPSISTGPKPSDDSDSPDAITLVDPRGKAPEPKNFVIGSGSEIKEWERSENLARALLLQRLPTTTAFIVDEKETVYEMWQTVVAEYTYKGAYSQTRLRREFLASHCPKNSDVQLFLHNLRARRTELKCMGITINDDDYRSTIIQSLPWNLANFVSVQLSIASLIPSLNGTIEPDRLINMICEEWERTRSHRNKGGPKGESSADDSMAVDTEGHRKGGKWKGKGKGKKGGCYECGDPDHWKRDCPKWKQKQADKKSKGGDANAVDSGVPDETFAFSEDEIPAAIANMAPGGTTITLFDSGAARHISPYRNSFANYTKIPTKTLRAANQQSFSAFGQGDVTIEVPNGSTTSQITLRGVLYAPDVGYTLVSVGRLDEEGYSTTFANGKCIIRDMSGTRLAEIPRTSRGMYKIESDSTPESANSVADAISLDELHRRLGHISPRTAKQLVQKGMITGLDYDRASTDKFDCPSCIHAKATRKPIAKKREGDRASSFGQEIHSDVWGPAPVSTRKGNQYYVTFTDDFSRYTHLELMPLKSDVFEAYKGFEAWCDTQHGAKIKCLHSDRGGEYTSKEFKNHLRTKGTVSKLTVHDTPQHNGVAERRNRTILERVRAFLHSSQLPKYLWGEAVNHAVWLMNRTKTKALDGKTPFEVLYGKKPNLSEVREFGEKVWVRVEGGNKLGGRVREGHWLGMDQTSNGVRIWWPDTRTTSIERNIHYSQEEALGENLEGEGVPLLNEIPTIPQIKVEEISPNPTEGHVPLTSENTQAPENSDIPQPPPLRRSERTRQPSEKARDILEGRAVTPVEEEEWQEVHIFAAEMAEMEGDPTSLGEARKRADWVRWKEAMDDEMKNLKDAGTWELKEPKQGANVVGCKWVFKTKRDADGNVTKHKARLVAQGFSQIPGVDYFDTFAPVARLSSIRTVLAIAAARDMEIHQIDVKAAYLNGKLNDDEEIYMRQPPGHIDPYHPHHVCHLRKTLYGLKQSGRRWYQRLCEILVDHLGFTRCEVDHSTFYKHNPPDLTIILVHVDDCTLTSTKTALIDWAKSTISKFVEISDLGEIHWLLGIEIKRVREERRLMLSQRAYIEASLHRFGFEDLSPVSIPMDPSIRLTSDHSPKTTNDIARMARIPYQEAVGTLMYAAIGTRPDIAYAIQVLSKFTKNPGQAHWDAVKRVFRYLKKTKDLWLTYGGEGEQVSGFTDADGNTAEDRRATSGFAFVINGGAVSWSAKRQELVTLSTTESEYVAATHAAKEALWLRSLISQVFDISLVPTPLHSDNQSAIALAKDHQYHARTKHIDIRYHFIRWIIDEGKIRLIYCPTNDMVADIFTKALPSPKVKHFAQELGLATV